MKRFFRMYGVEQKLFFRSPDVILFNLAMPLVVSILITLIAGNKAAAGLAPLLAGLAIRFGMPLLEKTLMEFTGSPFVLLPYYGLFHFFFCVPLSGDGLLYRRNGHAGRTGRTD